MPVKKKTTNQVDAIQKAESAVRVARQAAKDAKKLIATQILTRDEMEELIQAVVERTFAGFGVDITDKDEIKELIKDREYTRAWRNTIQKGTRTGWITFVTVAVTGLMGVLWLSLKIALGGHL